MNPSHSDNFARLVEWIEGNLSQEETQALEVELARADDATRDNVEWLRRFHQASQEIQLAAPPSHVREELERRFASFSESRRAPSLFQRMVAALTFDSGAQRALAGVRSATMQGLERQLIFSTETAEVALNILPRGTEHIVYLTGQIFAGQEDAPVFSIQLLQGSEEVALTTTDDIGEFAFEALPVGEYELIISGDEVEIIIPSVILNP
jgi:hypothetical protein